MSANKANQLVYLVYGNNPVYRLEAKFSILTALREKAPPSILLYTDKPADFDGWPIEIKVLNSALLDQWMGVDGYIHKRKACAFADALQRSNVCIFIDTDTFFVQPAQMLFARLESADWLVDKIEARFGDWSHLPLYQQTSSYLRSEYAVTDSLLMINSGVLGFAVQARKIQDEAACLIDKLCRQAPGIHIIEQFAVAVAARNLKRPAEAKDIVFHYHSEKEYWRAVIQTFFSKHGEQYHHDLPKATHEAPQTRPKPAWWHRLAFKVRSLALPKGDRRFARMAYYALHMPSDIYSQSCCIEYARAMAKESPETTHQLISGCLPSHWGRILDTRSKATLLSMLAVSDPGAQIK